MNISKQSPLDYWKIICFAYCLSLVETMRGSMHTSFTVLEKGKQDYKIFHCTTWNISISSIQLVPTVLLFRAIMSCNQVLFFSTENDEILTFNKLFQTPKLALMCYVVK